MRSFGFIFFFPVACVLGVAVVVVVCPWGCIMNLQVGIVHLLGRRKFGEDEKLHAYLPGMEKKLAIESHAASISLRS